MKNEQPAESKDQSVSEVKKKKNPNSLGRVKMLDIVLAIRQLSVMLKSSLAIEDVLKSLYQQTQNPKLKEAFGYVLTDVQSGMSLSESFAKYKKVFPGIISSIVNAGEQGGTLEKNLFYLADYLKKDYELKKKVKGALFYPMMVFGLTIFEAMGVVFFILPRLESLFTSFKNVPAFTLGMISTAKMLRDNKLTIGLGLLVFVVGFSYFMKTPPGRKFKDRLVLGVPIIKKLTKHSILANFSRTLGILLESGIPLIKALQITETTIENHIYAKIVAGVREKVQAGMGLAEALSANPTYFPSTFTKMIEVGEQTSSLEENLLYLHEFYAEDVEDMSNNLTTLLEPLLLVFIGLMIGGLAISIIGPIYQLTSSINN